MGECGAGCRAVGGAGTDSFLSLLLLLSALLERKRKKDYSSFSIK